jgi:hypothetical protein
MSGLPGGGRARSTRAPGATCHGPVYPAPHAHGETAVQGGCPGPARCLRGLPGPQLREPARQPRLRLAAQPGGQLHHRGYVVDRQVRDCSGLAGVIQVLHRRGQEPSPLRGRSGEGLRGMSADLDVGEEVIAEMIGVPRVSRTGILRLIHAATWPFRYSSRTSCGVLYPSPSGDDPAAARRTRLGQPDPRRGTGRPDRPAEEAAQARRQGPDAPAVQHGARLPAQS